MDRDDVTKSEVLDLFQQGRSTNEVLSLIGQRLNVDTASVIEKENVSPLRLIETLVPDRGQPTEGSAEAAQSGMRFDMEGLRTRSPEEVADFLANMQGIDISRLREEEGMSDSDIIVALGHPESVARAEGLGPAFERASRAIVRGIPPVAAGAGAAVLAAPSGPIASGGFAIAAGTAAAPIGDQLEEFIFGPRVPLPPDEYAQGRFGDVAGTGLMLLPTPYAFTRGMDPSRLSFLASRTGRDLTPAQAIGVRAVTRPGQSLTSEALALTGGAVGSAAAAQGFPGNEIAQFAAELAGSLAVPAERLTTVIDKGLSPAFRAFDAARTRDLSRLSRRVALRDPETGEERLLDLSKGVDRRSAEILRTSGWEQLPATDPSGISSVMRLRSETALARLVGNIAKDFQENPLETARALNAAASNPRGLRQLAEEYGVSPDQIPEKLPVVALADSPTLRAIYTTIQSSSGALGPTRARARSQDLVRGFEGIEQMVRMLQNTGDPEDFAAAMRLQKEVNEGAIDAMLDANLAPVTAAVGKLLMDDPTARSRAGKAISEAVKDSLTTARFQESQLWNRVDRSEPVELTNTQAEAQSIMQDLGIVTEAGEVDLSRIANPRLRTFLEVIDEATRRSDVFDAFDADNPLAALERMLAREAQDFMGDSAEEAVVPTVGNALVLKRNLFDRMIAASSSANPDFGTAQYYNRLYGALMEDLGVSANAVAQRGGEGLTENQNNLLQANSFSRALNDTFTRAFAGQTLARDARGGRQMVPELMGRRLLSGGDDSVSYVMKELDDAVTFTLNNLNLSPEEAALAQGRVDTLRDNQETLLRVIASRVTNPATNEINLPELRRLMRSDNPNGIAQALERFDGLRQDLQNAETAQRLLQEARKGASQAAQSQNWLSRALDGPPAKLVNEAIGVPGDRQPDAAARLRGIIRLADQNGGEFAEFARRGLFDTIMDQGVAYSGGATGSINFDALRNYFFTPLGRQGKEGPTLAAVLREQGFLTDTQLTDLSSLMRQGRRIEQALETSGTDAELRDALKEVAPFTIATVGRFVGAAQGARIQRAMGLSTIQIPALAARIGGQLTERIPTTSLQDTLVKFLDDPEFAEIILRRSAQLEGMSPNRAIGRAQRMLTDFEAALVRNALIAPVAGEISDIRDQGFVLPFDGSPFAGAAQAATAPDPAELEAYLQSIAPPQAAPAPAAPALPPSPQGAAPQGAPPSPVPSSLRPAAGAQSTPAPQSAEGGGMSTSPNYSALFPNDPIAPMMQQREMEQGIGSLMGAR